MKHVTHKFNHWFLRYVFRFPKAMTLGHTVLYKYPKEKISEDTIQHELKHVEQIEKLGLIKFYVKYLYFNLRYGYRKNPFEVEARGE